MRFEEDFLLRLCKPEEAERDAPILAPLVRALALEEGVVPPPDVAKLTDLIYALLTSGFSEFLVAEVQGEPVGCLQVNYRLSTWAAGPYAHIEDVYVRDDVRSLGIGRKMLDYACHRADARGCVFAEIDVRPDNAQALRVYERMGFDPQSVQVLRCDLPRVGRCDGHTHTEEEAEQ
jgi:ribosomal protein S18 acetylase RimI-like enzyme